MCGLGSKRIRRLLPVGGIELAQITRHALVDLSKASLHLTGIEHAMAAPRGAVLIPGAPTWQERPIARMPERASVALLNKILARINKTQTIVTTATAVFCSVAGVSGLLIDSAEQIEAIGGTTRP
jgi:hypothetical protein